MQRSLLPIPNHVDQRIPYTNLAGHNEGQRISVPTSEGADQEDPFLENLGGHQIDQLVGNYDFCGI